MASKKDHISDNMDKVTHLPDIYKSKPNPNVSETKLNNLDEIRERFRDYDDRDDKIMFADQILKDDPREEGVFDRYEYNESMLEYQKKKFEETLSRDFNDFIIDSLFNMDTYEKKILNDNFPEIIEKIKETLFKKIELNKKVAQLVAAGLRTREDYFFFYLLQSKKLTFNNNIVSSILTGGNTLTKNHESFIFTDGNATEDHIIDRLKFYGFPITGNMNMRKYFHSLPDIIITRLIDISYKITFNGNIISQFINSIYGGNLANNADLQVFFKKYLNNISAGRGIFNPKKYNLLRTGDPIIPGQEYKLKRDKISSGMDSRFHVINDRWPKVNSIGMNYNPFQKYNVTGSTRKYIDPVTINRKFNI